jgi:hypothetical protein
MTGTATFRLGMAHSPLVARAISTDSTLKCSIPFDASGTTPRRSSNLCIPVIRHKLAHDRSHIVLRFIAHVGLGERERVRGVRSDGEDCARIRGMPLDDCRLALFDQQHRQRILEQLADSYRLRLHKPAERIQPGRQISGLHRSGYYSDLVAQAS